MSRKKEANQLTKLAEGQGWVVTHTRNGHVKYVSPDGEIVIGSATPGGGRSTLNTRARLMRAGLRVPRKGG